MPYHRLTVLPSQFWKNALQEVRQAQDNPSGKMLNSKQFRGRPFFLRKRGFIIFTSNSQESLQGSHRTKLPNLCFQQHFCLVYMRGRKSEVLCLLPHLLTHLECMRWCTKVYNLSLLHTCMVWNQKQCWVQHLVFAQGCCKRNSSQQPMKYNPSNWL